MRKKERQKNNPMSEQDNDGESVKARFARYYAELDNMEHKFKKAWSRCEERLRRASERTPSAS
jgi:hypothetical protein